MLLTWLEPVALSEKSNRNTRVRVEKPPSEIMIVLFGISSLNVRSPNVTISLEMPAAKIFDMVIYLN